MTKPDEIIEYTRDKKSPHADLLILDGDDGEINAITVYQGRRQAAS